MSQAAAHVWHIRDLLDVNRILDVSPIGWQDRDKEGLTKEERLEKSNEIQRLGSKFDGLDPITIENLGSRSWAFRRTQPRTLKAKPAMSLGGYSVVTPACRAVLEQSDLGQVDFHQIEVLDINRKTVVWPELYVLHIRNAKHSIDVEAELAAKTIRDENALERQRQNRPLPPILNPRHGRPITPRSNALEGPDLWRETQLHSAFRSNLYMSENLHTLLEEAGMAKAWGLHKVAVGDR